MLNNDKDCFSGIYDMYAARLLGMIMKWVKEDKKAEILLHNAFVKAWHDRRLFEPSSGAFYNWLCSHARFCFHEDVACGISKEV